jgi:hypothetical protein
MVSIPTKMGGAYLNIFCKMDKEEFESNIEFSKYMMMICNVDDSLPLNPYLLMAKERK